VRLSQKTLDEAIKNGIGDLIVLRRKLNESRESLQVWGDYILQAFAAPTGMVAVFEREDHREELIPVSYLGLTRAGRVLPYILQGNCESKVPSDYPNFLRIDFAQLMANEACLELIGTELAPSSPEKEVRVAWGR
jgi:hypothetical protein